MAIIYGFKEIIYLSLEKGTAIHQLELEKLGVFIIITLSALDHFIAWPNVGPLWASYSCPNEIQFLKLGPAYKKVRPDPNKGSNQQKVKI